MTKKFILLLIVISFICCSKPQQPGYKVNLTLETDVNKVLEEGEFNTYRWIADFTVDDEGSIYVVDNMSNNNRLIKVDRNGQYQWRLNTNGQGPGEFLKITDACCLQDKIFVCDQSKKKIITFSKNGVYIDEFKIKLNSEPQRIAIDSNGILYVNLMYPINESVLHKYNLQGEYLGSIIKKRYYEKIEWFDSFLNGIVFCIDRHNDIIMAYRYSNNIFKYNASGRQLKTWEMKLSYKPEKPRLVHPDPNSFEMKGDIIINDIAVDSHDRIYVLWGSRGNEQGMQVDLFSPQGKLMSEFRTGIKPNYDHQLIAIGPGDDFYVDNQIEEPNIYRFLLEITKK